MFIAHNELGHTVVSTERFVFQPRFGRCVGLQMMLSVTKLLDEVDVAQHEYSVHTPRHTAAVVSVCLPVRRKGYLVC